MVYISSVHKVRFLLNVYCVWYTAALHSIQMEAAGMYL